ncbi:MAG: sigma-70 family RNA polymerase sigma factor [Planctomycetota bacterium]|nr:MAG: sigma-70 family RNA polymerase sigma factor [Planctomycetota bacterium]
MDSPARAAATNELRRLTSGEAEAAERLLPLVYEELRVLAGDCIRGESSGHTLQATALVHEAWIRLIGSEQIEWRGRAQFRALAATAMRHVLTDHARGRAAQKRGGNAQRVTLAEAIGAAGSTSIDLLELHEALEQLAALDARQHRVVELRFFGGLSVEESADVLGCSITTVEREWRSARAWLSARLRGAGGG